MTTIRINDHPQLAPHEQCGHCGLVAPAFPLCWGCQRAMLDWPQTPELFLIERGWEKIDHLWHEPLERCMGPIPDGVELGMKHRFYKGPGGSDTNQSMTRVSGMVEDAEGVVLAERAWSASESLRRMPKGPQLLHDGHMDNGDRRVKHGPDRDFQAEAAEHLASAEAKLTELVRKRDAGEFVQIRARHRSALDTAVRDELNHDIGETPIVQVREPRWTEQQIQDMLPAHMRAQKSVSDSGTKTLPKEYPYGQAGGPGSPRYIFRDETKLRNEKCTVFYEACRVCRRYPDKFYNIPRSQYKSA